MNILVLEKGCPECSTVKINIDLGKVEDDSFFGRDGEKICIFFTLSSQGTKELLQRLGVESVAPIMITSELEIITETEEILKKIRLLGYGK